MDSRLWPPGDDDQPHLPDAETIRLRAMEAVFGQPVVQNNFRSVVVEVMIAEALGADWHWCAGDWRGWDFEHQDGTRLEVKQSAARQSWSTQALAPGRFDIKPRQGYYDGPTWVVRPGRQAQIYIFGYNCCITDRVDHFDPLQWLFYAVRTRDLPDQKSISLKALGRLSASLRWPQLKPQVEALRASSASAP